MFDLKKDTRPTDPRGPPKRTRGNWCNLRESISLIVCLVNLSYWVYRQKRLVNLNNQT